MVKALGLIATGAKYAFKVAAKMRIAEWICKHVVIPDITGAVEPGPWDTSRVPPMEGLFDLVSQRHVHFFTLAKSARVGGTLFCFGYLLHKIANNPGPILWVDASNMPARQLFRR